MGQSSREVRIIGPLRDAGCLNRETAFFCNFVVISENTSYLFHFVCVFSVVVVN